MFNTAERFLMFALPILAFFLGLPVIVGIADSIALQIDEIKGLGAGFYPFILIMVGLGAAWCFFLRWLTGVIVNKIIVSRGGEKR